MLKLYMRKKIIFAMICFCIINNLGAKEPLLARLEGTISNEIQKFGIQNYTFECKPYGILTLEALYKSSKTDSVCQKSIDRYYKKNPKLKYYADRILKYKQLYHIEIKNRECAIYAKGQTTLSELLLYEGLALKKPMFRDEEFDSYFTNAQRKAKIEKKGLWGENIFANCVKELYK